MPWRSIFSITSARLSLGPQEMRFLVINFSAAATDSRSRMLIILVPFVLRICSTLIASSRSINRLKEHYVRPGLEQSTDGASADAPTKAMFHLARALWYTKYYM